MMKPTIFILLFTLPFAACKKSNNTPDNSVDPSLSVETLSTFEGNAGTKNFNVVVKLSAASSKTVTVKLSTSGMLALPVDDFISLTDQSISFQPGELSKEVPISIVADDLKEPDEDFRVTLSSALNASIALESAVIQILNDDTKVPFSNEGYDAPTSYAGYTLAWSDEFNGSSLDGSSWEVEGGNGCPAVCGWGNNELEFYTGRPENLFFQDGKMIIEARKEAYSGFNYTSSKIVSRGKKTFKYGRIDFRAKLPTGKGIWPAFWMLPQGNVYGGWPTSGEIDIMEMVGNEPNRTHGTLHYGPGPGSTSINRNVALPTGSLHDEFHVYSLEWQADQLKWYLDGNLFSTINKADIPVTMTWPFNENFFFIINLAVGGNWPGNPDATTVLPQWLIVDYVRVYQ